jgi:hypothetical protein
MEFTDKGAARSTFVHVSDIQQCDGILGCIAFEKCIKMPPLFCLKKGGIFACKFNIIT